VAAYLRISGAMPIYRFGSLEVMMRAKEPGHWQQLTNFQ
jgi:hypothetical protein